MHHGFVHPGPEMCVFSLKKTKGVVFLFSFFFFWGGEALQRPERV